MKIRCAGYWMGYFQVTKTHCWRKHFTKFYYAWDVLFQNTPEDDSFHNRACHHWWNSGWYFCVSLHGWNWIIFLSRSTLTKLDIFEPLFIDKTLNNIFESPIIDENVDANFEPISIDETGYFLVVDKTG